VIRLSRLALAAVAILFGLYHALLGFLFLGEYQNPAFAIVGLIAYLSALLLATFDKSGLKMRAVSAAIVLIVSISLPQLIFAALRGQTGKLHHLAHSRDWNTAGNRDYSQV